MDCLSLVLSILSIVVSICICIKQRQVELFNKRRSVISDFFVAIRHYDFEDSLNILVCTQKNQYNILNTVDSIKLDIEKLFSNSVFSDFQEIEKCIKKSQYFNYQMTVLLDSLKQNDYKGFDYLRNCFIKEIEQGHIPITVNPPIIVTTDGFDGEELTLNYEELREKLDLVSQEIVRRTNELENMMIKELKC